MVLSFGKRHIGSNLLLAMHFLRDPVSEIAVELPFSRKIRSYPEIFNMDIYGLDHCVYGRQNVFPEEPEIRRICLKVVIVKLLMFTKAKYAQHTLWQPFICFGFTKNQWFLNSHLTKKVCKTSEAKLNTQLAIGRPALRPVKKIWKIRGQKFFDDIFSSKEDIFDKKLGLKKN